jgi:tetratricopeptide (TPR) repeat protein
MINKKHFFFSITILSLSFLSLHLSGIDKKEALTEEISDIQARVEYATMLTHLKRFDEALEQYGILLKKDPQNLQYRLEEAKIYYYLGRSDQAFHIIENLNENNLDDKEKIMIADIYLSLKNYSKAEEIYQNLLKDNPQNSFLKFKLAELYSWQKRYPESIHYFEEALNERPDDIQLRRKYALVLMWMGNEEMAAKELEKTLR